MQRDFRQGYLGIDFPTEPFHSPIPLLLASLRLSLATLPFLAAIMLGVFLPVKLAFHFATYLMDVPTEGILSYFLLELGDLLLGALVAPAIVYGLLQYRRGGRTASVGESLRWGGRQWVRTAGNRLKVEVTVMLYGALLIIPGVVASIRLIFTDVIVAIEADRQPDPLHRSRQLSRGHGWLIFFTVLPVMLVGLGGLFLVTDRTPGAGHSRLLYAVTDTGLSLVEQLGVVPALLMYLGLSQNSVTKLKP